MGWQLTGYSLLGFGAAALSALVATVTWRYRDGRATRPFVALMVPLTGWSLASGIQLGFTTASEQVVWQQLAFAIGAMIPTLWLVFALYYAGEKERLTPRVKAALALEPAVAAILFLTNPAHELMWREAPLTTAGGSPLIDLSLHVGYYAHIAYSYVLVGAGLAVLALVGVRTALYRKQVGLLFLGVVPPLAVNIAYTFDVSWPVHGLDLTPFAFAVTGVMFSLGLYRFDLLERTPIARQHVLDEMGDGLVVVDDDGVVVDSNDIARQALDRDLAVGDRIGDGDGGGSPVAALGRLDGRTVNATVDGQQRAYDVDWSTLPSPDGDAAGHVVTLRDITERKEYEQRLQVAQRVLRHNLRNDMEVVRGHAEHLAERTNDGERESARRIITAADGLIELSEKTKTLATATAYETTSRTAVDVRDRLIRLLEEQRIEYDARIDADVPEPLWLELPDEELLDIAVRNLVENAIEHNDSDRPWVGVSVDEGPEWTRIHVADNGPGIPTMERRVLEAGDETPLQHGEGVGLWLTYWSVTAAGGSISFDARQPRGSVVTLEFPSTDASDDMQTSTDASDDMQTSTDASDDMQAE